MDKVTGESSLKALPYAILRCPSFSRDKHNEILNCDSNELESHIISFFNDVYAREALNHMAPDFASRILPKMATQDLRESDVTVLLRYISRLCYRCTPFGLAASYSVVPVGVGKLPRLDSKDKLFLSVNLDESVADILRRATEEMASEHSDLWVANDTIYHFSEEVRFIKIDDEFNSKKGAILSSIVATDYLLKVLDYTRKPRTKRDISIMMKKTFSEEAFTESEINKFIDDMVKQQLLTHDHYYTVTNERRLFSLFSERAPGDAANIRRDMELLSKRAVEPSEVSRRITGIVSSYTIIPTNTSIIQLDALRKLQEGSGIPGHMVRRMERLLGVIATFMSPRHAVFAPFITQWEERYGDCDLPLMFAVDEFSGLTSSYGRGQKTIVDHIPAARFKYETYSEIFQDVFARSYSCTSEQVEVDSGSLLRQPHAKSMSQDIHDLTGWFRFWRRESDGEILIELTSISGWPLGRLFGRFANDSLEIKSMLRQSSNADCDEGTILAELIHHPRERIANVCNRPSLAEYEISIRSGVSGDAQQILLSDLIVCRDGRRLRLRSRTHKKWVELRLSTAHNHNLYTNMPVYRFLVEIIGQNNLSLDAIFGRTYQKDAISVPRLVLDGVCVSPRSWRIPRGIVEVINASGSDLELLDISSSFRRLYKVPDFVTITEDGDHQLLLNMNSVQCLRQLRASIRRNPNALLYEYGFSGCVPAIVGPDGEYNHECLIAFKSCNKVPKPKTDNRVVLDIFEGRSNPIIFSLESDWICFNVYIDCRLQDNFLQKFWSDVIGKYRLEGEISSAFFVRYIDELGSHLRLRMRLVSRGAVIRNFVVTWLDAESENCGVTMVRQVHYSPEWNRYGGRLSMPIVHDLFSLSSDIVISYHQEDGVVQAALCSNDLLLKSLGFLSIQERLVFARAHAKGFLSEFDFDSQTRKESSEVASSLPRLRNLNISERNTPQAKTKVIEMLDAGRRLIRLSEEGLVSQSLWSITSSITHMHLNRMFSVNSRAQEAVFWDISRRFYERESALAGC